MNCFNYIKSLFRTDKRKVGFKENSSILVLAPRVITDKEGLKKIQPYLDNLKDAINTKEIYNIALTAPYGAGKSTIIKTFIHQNPEWEFLKISLASFSS